MTRVTIVGAGNMGRGIATRGVAGGHDVEIVDRDPLEAQELGGTAAALEPGARFGGQVVVFAATSTNPVDTQTWDRLATPPGTSSAERIAALFDIDGTLIITGGAGAAAWRLAFDELYGIPAEIGEFTDTGMTDPDVGHRTFAAVLGREPSRAELAKLMERRLDHLYQTVADSQEYRVLGGADWVIESLAEGLPL